MQGFTITVCICEFDNIMMWYLNTWMQQYSCSKLEFPMSSTGSSTKYTTISTTTRRQGTLYMHKCVCTQVKYFSVILSVCNAYIHCHDESVMIVTIRWTRVKRIKVWVWWFSRLCQCWCWWQLWGTKNITLGAKSQSGA